MSLRSAFLCARQSVQLPARKRMAILKIVSPAGTAKKARILLIVYDHLFVPAEVARAAASVEPHVNFEYFQMAGPVLKFVITPTCTYTFPAKFNRPWLPFVASTVIVTLSLSFENSGIQLSNCDRQKFANRITQSSRNILFIDKIWKLKIGIVY